MITGTQDSHELFSFHLVNLPLRKIPRFLFSPTFQKKIPGLYHSESFLTMNLGEPILSARRYNFKSVAFFAWWSEEFYLNEFLKQPSYQFLENGWHVRMKLYRRWGSVSEIRDAKVNPALATIDQPVIAVTLARLNILEASRFIQWGKPVESQVRDHQGKTLALAAMRPLNTFCTFSVWKNEMEMLKMVHGRDKLHDGEKHQLAMRERDRKDFHYEFTTMRLIPFQEVGEWNGKKDYTAVWV